jgi:hypothetical protein
MAQGGWFNYTGSHNNGGRIVRYTRSTSTWRCYRLPGRSPEPNGFLLHDGEIDVAASGLDAVATLNLATVTDDFTDCSAGPPIPPCPVDRGPCWEIDELPSLEWDYPTHIERDDNGVIWLSTFEGNAVWRRDGLATWTSWPMLPTTRTPLFAWPYSGAGPWHFRLDGSHVRAATMTACSLDSLAVLTGRWTRAELPCGGPSDLATSFDTQVDASGLQWVSGAFSLSGGIRAIGYVKGAASAFFPPPAVLGSCAADHLTPGSGTMGMKVSADAREIDAAMYYCGAILRLTQVP